MHMEKKEEKMKLPCEMVVWGTTSLERKNSKKKKKNLNFEKPKVMSYNYWGEKKNIKMKFQLLLTRT